MLNVRVQMLDDSVTLFQVQVYLIGVRFFPNSIYLIIILPLCLQTKADGSVLFEQVCKQLNLLEADYFGLEYQEGSTKVYR